MPIGHMSLIQPVVSRRQFLAMSSLAFGSTILSGCRHGLEIFETGKLLTAPGVPTDSRLTIDVHCHIFNGTDLQIEKFLGDVIFETWWGKAAGEILQAANWKLAPSGRAEKSKLEALIRSCKTPTPGQVSLVAKDVQKQVEKHREDGYGRARLAVLQVQKKASANTQVAPLTPEAQTHYAATQAAKNQIFDTFLKAEDYASLQTAAQIPPTLTDAMIRPLSVPLVPGIAETADYKMAQASVNAQSFSLKGIVNFIVQYFQYRFVSAQDYLNLFTPAAGRDVDLLLASMVDYDWWLAGGCPTPTPLSTQVEVSALISQLSDGRVHGFAPFCPLREVAAQAKFKNKCGDVAESSLAFVQDAVRRQGCVGVKLYPPMGFAAYGNQKFDVRGPTQAPFWKSDLLPEWTAGQIPYPDGSSELLGKRMDDVLEKLYLWCEEEQVPILAHTNETNGATDSFKALASAEYWALALVRHPRLRVNFGHLGGMDNDTKNSALVPPTSTAFIKMLGSSKSPLVYGDSA